jgi:hypothetical protein
VHAKFVYDEVLNNRHTFTLLPLVAPRTIHPP